MKKIGKSLHKKDIKLHAFLSIYKKIYIYGAGIVAKRLVCYLKEEEYNISGLIVTEKKENSTIFNDIKIYELNDIKISEEDGIIIGVKFSSQEEILRRLHKNGIHKEQIYPQRLYLSSLPSWKGMTNNEQQNNINSVYFKEYTSLDEIGIRYNTDKCSNYHNYLNKYEFFLEKWKNESIVLLELGIFKAASLYLWKDYFKNGIIYGVDIDENCKKYESESCKIIISDLAYEDNLDELGKIQPNIIIDDASHYWSHQIKALCHLLPALAQGGIYILEDLGTSFDLYNFSGYDDAVISTYDFLSAISEIVCSNESLRVDKMNPNLVPFIKEIEILAKEIELISFIHESCIIVKR